MWPSLRTGAAEPWGANYGCISRCCWWHRGHRGGIFGLTVVRSTADCWLSAGAWSPLCSSPGSQRWLSAAQKLLLAGEPSPGQFSSCFVLLEHVERSRSENKDVRIYWCQMFRFEWEVAVGPRLFPLLCAAGGKGKGTVPDMCPPLSSLFSYLLKHCLIFTNRSDTFCVNLKFNVILHFKNVNKIYV